LDNAAESPRLSVENDVIADWQPPASTLVQNWFYRRSTGMLFLGDFESWDLSELDQFRV